MGVLAAAMRELADGMDKLRTICGAGGPDDDRALRRLINTAIVLRDAADKLVAAAQFVRVKKK